MSATASEPKTRALHYYRMIGGRRVRYKMVLDETNTLISDEQANKVKVGIEPPKETDDEDLRSKKSAQLAMLRNRGFEMKMDTVGGIEITSAPQLEIEMARFYTSAPCFFEGCEELRAAFEKIKEGAMDEQGECSDCTLGQLMNQFRPQLEPVIQKHIALHGHPEE